MKGDLPVIPANSEEYISITKIVDSSTEGHDYREKIRYVFIDSLRFLPASLSKLASQLPSEKKKILNYEFAHRENYSVEKIKLLERKGVFPYDYVDSFEKLEETTLPQHADFFNEMNEENVSTDDYNFAHTVWNEFDIKTLDDYAELYLKTDILLLADVFQNFREKTYEIYELDPAHYLTLPSFSFDAMLKYTRAKIELLTDIEMLLFVEKGIRGGISQCSKRHVKANNKYMKELYNSEEKSIYLMDLDGKYFFI